MKIRFTLNLLQCALILIALCLVLFFYTLKVSAQESMIQNWVIGAESLSLQFQPPIALMKDAGISDEHIEQLLIVNQQVQVVGAGSTKFISLGTPSELSNLQSSKCPIDISGAGWTRCVELEEPNTKQQRLMNESITVNATASPTFTPTVVTSADIPVPIATNTTTVSPTVTDEISTLSEAAPTEGLLTPTATSDTVSSVSNNQNAESSNRSVQIWVAVIGGLAAVIAAFVSGLGTKILEILTGQQKSTRRSRSRRTPKNKTSEADVQSGQFDDKEL